METRFKDWLAGFVDGEGHFGINKCKYGPVCCQFVIQLRDDDLALLEHIQCELGSIGSINLPRSARVARFVICSRADTAVLVKLLDEHPLLSKKHHDYLVWRQAVLELQKPYPDRNLLLHLFDEIKDVRRYKPH